MAQTELEAGDIVDAHPMNTTLTAMCASCSDLEAERIASDDNESPGDNRGRLRSIHTSRDCSDRPLHNPDPPGTARTFRRCRRQTPDRTVKDSQSRPDTRRTAAGRRRKTAPGRYIPGEQHKRCNLGSQVDSLVGKRQLPDREEDQDCHPGVGSLLDRPSHRRTRRRNRCRPSRLPRSNCPAPHPCRQGRRPAPGL
jgi:hypothetical protein